MEGELNSFGQSLKTRGNQSPSRKQSVEGKEYRVPKMGGPGDPAHATHKYLFTEAEKSYLDFGRKDFQLLRGSTVRKVIQNASAGWGGLA